ncbi:MAG TPA: TetR/AcrR family transcriptional regulator [Spirochaetes bacterium]|nr:TetR/AcrR family transcriptional regulator [Spirochaetota bacterium]
MNKPPERAAVPEAGSEEAPTTRHKILMAAKTEFAERGFRGSRIGSIAKRAGVNQALVHYYFESKEKLYESLLRRLFGVTELRSLERFIAGRPLTPSQELYVMLYFMSFGTMSTYDPEMERIMFREYLDHETRFFPLVREFVLPWLEKLEGIIKRGVAAGEFATPDPTLSMIHIVSFFHGYDSMREIFSGTKFHGKLYGRKSREAVFHFVLESACKSIAPVGVGLSTSLPEDMAASLRVLIDEIAAAGSGEDSPGRKTVRPARR